jgi:hypothetical protein
MKIVFGFLLLAFFAVSSRAQTSTTGDGKCLAHFLPDFYSKYGQR